MQIMNNLHNDFMVTPTESDQIEKENNNEDKNDFLHIILMLDQYVDVFSLHHVYYILALLFFQVLHFHANFIDCWFRSKKCRLKSCQFSFTVLTILSQVEGWPEMKSLIRVPRRDLLNFKMVYAKISRKFHLVCNRFISSISD